ncbi:uncharacterized protein LOC116843067 [Odontomachus brunneus]|uniref:uncharacterized protein LOC116843067 n=1 Tax=Odontomachus brunneus TaxID=486640 RepID=UPI0013F292BD|nr:uncharacterized protein LOC116843067 [Odontomachus brunneus]
MANIKVAVRVRPISARESKLTGSQVVVRSELNEISLTNLKVSSSKAGDSRERTRRYGFDYCFDSSDPEAKNYVTQATIYQTLGQSILDAMFLGYNSCLVAYGQSASGKTYTMMGTKEDPGLIPRLCEGLFSRVEQENGRTYRVTISYLEIYNERVRDLLKPSATVSGLKVREHPRLGPYVQGLTHHVVPTLGSLMSYVEEGTKARKTASTLQNPSSSRSHALLTVGLSQETVNGDRLSERLGGSSSCRRQDAAPRGGSRLHLVDLAGSESAATCGGVHRLKKGSSRCQRRRSSRVISGGVSRANAREGANINKSLVALGNVISALAERGSTGSGPGRRYIPYRDSSLTWLLKDALGGNATTIMLATISPASGSYNETAHTLRFAQRAQSVVNRPVVNEDPVARLIRELRDEVARLKSLLLEKDIDQGTKKPCCCGKVQSSTDSSTNPQYCEEQDTHDTSRLRDPASKNYCALSKKSFDALPIRRFNSSDSVTTYETGCSGFVRKFSSYEYLQSTNHFTGNYNRARVTELNDEEDEVVDEINEPVFVDIPTLVAVLIKPDDSLQESSTQIEEICSDEVQEDSIDADFIEGSNEDLDGSYKIDDVELDDRGDGSVNYCSALEDSGIGELPQTPSNPASVERSRPKGKFSKQNSVDLPSSNLNVSREFGSIEGISKKKEPIVALQRSHTNLEKRSTLPDRGKKLNNIREVDDRKGNVKLASIWKAIGSVGSKDQLQRKSSNDSDKSLKDSISGKSSNSNNNIYRKPSLENLKRKTSKDSSSSSSKEEQILISSLTRDKLLRRKSSLEQEAIARPHTAIQRVKRAEIVAAVTERLYSSRKHTEETNNMATNSGNTSGTRSPPEGTDMKIPNSSSSSSGFAARTKLQEISRKMLLKRRRINVETQTETASTLRFKDTASLTDEPKVVLQDVGVLTDDHTNCEGSPTTTMDYRMPVLRVKDIATLTDRPRTNIYRCKDAESLVNDLEFKDTKQPLQRSPRNDSVILSDDTQNYAKSNQSESAEVSEFYPEGDKKAPCADSWTNTFVSSPSRNSAAQTVMCQEAVHQRKDTGCGIQCCSLTPANNPEKNVISISLPDMINITIESTNGLESRIAVMDGGDLVEEKPKPVSSDKESQTDKQVKHQVEGSFLEDLSVRSTAIQADGRIFRIENIFQDPRSKSSSDAAFDLRKDTAIKKSVTFRNSLGTSSIIEMKENGTEMEWDKMYLQHSGQKKRSIFKDGLTRAFIARRRSYSLSPRRPAYRLVRHELWKNWTLPCPGKSPGLVGYSREMVDTDLRSVDDRSSSAINDECTSDDKIVEDTSRHSFCQTASNFEDSKKLESVPIKSLLDYDHNFSDDSLDYEEDNVAREASDAKLTDSHESYENLCPPDVVAHTKKETSKPASHVDAINAQSSMDDDFDITEVELPKKKPAEASSQNPIHDYKSLILGSFSYVVDNDSEEGISAEIPGVCDNINKKKVSFSDPSSPEEIKDIVSNPKALVKPKQMILKSIIKKMKKKKSGAAESLDVVRSNVEIDQSSQRKKLELTINEKVPSVARENEDLENSKEQSSDKKVEFSNEDSLEEIYSESDSVISEDEDEAGFRAASRRNILEEYLNEAMTFMRNMNSINEYMSATNMLENYGKCRRRRRDRQRRDHKDYTKSRGRREIPKDDADKHLKPDDNNDDYDEVVRVESYDKCLKGIERLEACIDKVSEHNRLLRDKYGIDVESAGAKSGLASPSVDSRRTFAVSKDDKICQREDVIPEDDVNVLGPSKVSSSFLSSNRADVVKRSDLNERERQGVVEVDKGDPNDVKNNNLKSRNDLEHRIFDQLMDAADSSSYWYWSLTRPRQRRLWKISDTRARSPTTCSKFRQTFCQNTRGAFDFHEIPQDYLGGIESSPRDFRKTKLSGPTENVGSTWTSTESEIDPAEYRDCDKPSAENRDQLVDIKMSNEPTILNTKLEYLDSLTDPASFPVEAGRMFREEDEITTKNTGSKDSLRIDSMNHKFGPPSVELKYPGSPRAKFLELLKERRRIVENSRGTSAF